MVVTSSIMEDGRDEPAEFNLREWAAKARMISRENTNSRRFSAPNIRSFREDIRSSFRSNITISSTASSPGYTLREEIDPSTYSFTTALKALQAKSAAYSWECTLSPPDGFALNSKWNEAEKYICNPLSGEVPMECLSAKTLSARSFRNLASRVTMSAPLIYSNSLSRVPHPKHSSRTSLTLHENHEVHQFPVDQVKKLGNMTRDAGTQSTPPELSSSSPSPAQTPSIKERSIKRSTEAEADEDSPTSDMPNLLKLLEKVEVKETREKEETKTKDQLPAAKEEIISNPDRQRAAGKQTKQYLWRCSTTSTSCTRQAGGCFSWKILWLKKRQLREKRHKPRKRNICIHHFNGYC